MPRLLKTLRELTPFILTLAFTLSYLYLFAYWTGFGINIFEYMKVSDMLIYTAPVLLALLVGTVAGLPYVLFIDDLLRGLVKVKGRPKLFILSTLLLWMFLFVFFLLYDFVLFAVFLLLVVVYMGVTRSGMLSTDIPNKFVREIVLLLLIALPFGAVAYGIKQREKITDGRAYRYVEGAQMSDADLYHPGEKLRYVGKAGDYFFLLRADGKSVVVAQLSNFKSLELREFP